MRLFNKTVIVVFALIAVGVALPVLAQRTPPPAPTSAPSATPIMPPQATAVPPASFSPTVVLPAAPFEPRTQSDLNVLTGNVQRPNGLTILDNTLYIACTGDDTIYETDATSGATRTYIWGVQNAHALIAETDDTSRRLTLWVPDYDASTLTRISGGTVSVIARDLQSPWGIAAMDEAHFLITSVRGNSVMRINRDGDAMTVISGLAAPTGIAADGTYAYVANSGSARRAIEWYPLTDLNGGATEGEVLVRGVQSPTGVQVGADGMLYFAYSLGTRGVVGRVNPDECRENGGCGNDQVEIVLYTELPSPLAGLTIAPDMRVFVHTMFSPEIYWTQL